MDSKIEMLIEQVGRMTEGIVEFRIVQSEANAELKATLEKGFEELKAINERQAKNIEQLAEELKATNERQAKNIEQLAAVAAALAATTDRQSRQLEQILQSQGKA